MFLKHNWPTMVWAAIIWAVCSIPGSDLPQNDFWDNIGLDKFVHAGIFGILIFLMIKGFRLQSSAPLLHKHAVPVSFVLSVAYGGLMELFQEFMFTDRTADIWDFGANTLGCILGFVVYRRFWKN